MTATPSSRARRQQLPLGAAREQRVLDLHVADRVDRVRAAQRVGADLREPDVADVALLDELGDRPDGLLDRHVRVDAGRAVDVDVVGAQAAQRVAQEVADGGGAAVVAGKAVVGAAQRAELHADQRLLAPARRQRVADQHLVVAHPVEVAGVEQRDAGVERGVDRRDRLGVVGGPVGARHPHAAQADRADLRAARAQAPSRERAHRAQRLDGVEHRLGDRALGRGRDMLLARRGDDRHLVVLRVEAHARLRDVVADDRVDRLALELLPRPRERAVAVLGREADDRLGVAARGRQPGEHVGGSARARA